MYVTGRSKEQLEHDPTPDRGWRPLDILTQRPFLVVLDGLERLLMAYARTDAAYIDDTVLDEYPATRTGKAIGGPKGAGTSPSSVRNLRGTANVRAGQFLRTLATSAGASWALITSRLVPAELGTPMGRPIAGCALHSLPPAEADDPAQKPFAYHWGLTTARGLLLAWGASWPMRPPFTESTVKPIPDAAIDRPEECSSADDRGMR